MREDAGWVPQGADNDGEENIAVFFFFFFPGTVNQVSL